MSLVIRRMLHKLDYEQAYMEHKLMPNMFPHPGPIKPFKDTE